MGLSFLAGNALPPYTLTAQTIESLYSGGKDDAPPRVVAGAAGTRASSGLIPLQGTHDPVESAAGAPPQEGGAAKAAKGAVAYVLENDGGQEYTSEGYAYHAPGLWDQTKAAFAYFFENDGGQEFTGEGGSGHARGFWGDLTSAFSSIGSGDGSSGE